MNGRILLGVIEAVSDVEGVAAHELDSVLEECIDADVFQQLATHDASSWELSFDFAGHRVTVAGDGWILVDGERTTRWTSDEDGETVTPRSPA